MALHKAIKSGKEHRVEYGTKGQPYAKAVCKSCRNHGGCPWCEQNRLYKYRQRERLAKKELKDYEKF